MKSQSIFLSLSLAIFLFVFYLGLEGVHADDIDINVDLDGDISLEEGVLDDTDESVSDSNKENKEDVFKSIHELVQRKLYLNWRLSGLKLDDRITAESYLAVDLTDGEYILLKKNSSIAYPIASITKLMSAVIAAENIDRNQIIELTNPMLHTYGYSPSLFPGARLTSMDLMKVSLIQSTNDAAESLTYFMSTGVFVDRMNAKARQIGMDSSIFVDAHGLSPENLSTVGDIAKLLDYINIEHPEIMEITGEQNFQLPNPYGKLLTFRNLNTFHDIPGFIGGKTGYLPESKQTYATLLEIGDRTIAVVIFRSDGRKDDLETIYGWLKDNPKFKD